MAYILGVGILKGISSKFHFNQKTIQKYYTHFF